MEYVWTEKAEREAKKEGFKERKAGTTAYFGHDMLLVDGPTARAWLVDGYVAQRDVQKETATTERISGLLDSIKLYLDPEKYTFDYTRVEQLLEQAKQTVEQTARGVRPVDLPDDIPFSDSLDEEGQSSPYSYKDDMSPEKYERVMELYEMDHHTVMVYQSPDEKHCALEMQDNDGIPDENTGVVGKRYILPEGISIAEGSYRHHQLQNDDDPDQEVFIDNNEDGIPAIHLVYKDSGKSYQDIITMKEVETTKNRQTQEQEQPKHAPTVAADDDPRVLTVYQSPDRRHCALRQIENNGEYKDTDIPGRRYFLPDGFHVVYRYGHLCGILDAKGQDAYLINSDSGHPYLHTSDPRTGLIPSNGIPLRPYSESPAELWDEYNTMLNAIDYNYRHGRLGIDRNGTTFRLAITDCQKIIDNLYTAYVKNPNDKNVRDELAVKHEQLKWLENESEYPDHSIPQDKLQVRLNSASQESGVQTAVKTASKSHTDRML